MYSIIDENDTYEIFHKMFDVDINQGLPILYPKVRYKHNSSIGKIRIETFPMGNFDFGSMSGLSGFNAFCGFQITSPLFNEDAIEFLKFFNQEITFDNDFKLHIPRQVFEYNNVWNIKQAVFHASFSNCQRNYIDLRKDFWSVLNKLYDYQDGSDFQLSSVLMVEIILYLFSVIY